MRVKYSESIEFKALKRLNAIRGNAILRKDFDGLGSYRQISRAINKLIAQKKIVKIGKGVYAKAYMSETLKIPLIKGGFGETCKIVLKRKGIKWEPGSAEQAYNAGTSTQVPVRTIIQLKSRYRGHLAYGNRRLIMEKGRNAK